MSLFAFSLMMALLAIQPPHNLVWDYYKPMPVDDIEFDVERRDTLTSQWTLYCRTNQPPVSFEFTGNEGYFRVGAHYVDSSTGQ